ncbi:MAG: carbon-nitrogen hydrolase family protein [Pseudomonadota bacterium]
MKIAAAAYPLSELRDWDDYRRKQIEWVTEAATQGAELLVFPEYGRMELATLDGSDVASDLEASLTAVSRHSAAADDLMASLAQIHCVHILAGSGPVVDEDARPVNRAVLFGPNGPLGVQDKQVMTRFERETWDVVPGGPLQVFDTALGGIGVLICYDAEFPLLGRALVEQGAEILLVPSCTDSLAGYSRVRVGAMARALENQCIVVHSPTVQPAPWSPAVDENIGAAAIYGPPDLGFPPTGILAEGALDVPGWTYADIDRAAIARVRREGHVLNHAHWPESAARADQIQKHTDLP